MYEYKKKLMNYTPQFMAQLSVSGATYNFDYFR